MTFLCCFLSSLFSYTPVNFGVFIFFILFAHTSFAAWKNKRDFDWRSLYKTRLNENKRQKGKTLAAYFQLCQLFGKSKFIWLAINSRSSRSRSLTLSFSTIYLLCCSQISLNACFSFVRYAHTPQLSLVIGFWHFI